MKAIPTIYKGTAMRSRLEADWAATLDQRGLPWQYEPEGYELSDGTWYSPDFYLPSIRAWLEVKGDHGLRVTKIEQFAADLWAESDCTNTYDVGSPLVLLGQTPLNDEYPMPYERPRMVGVMGPGKRYSVGFSRCPSCDQPVIAVFWQTTCRICKADLPDGLDAYYDAWFDGLFQPFVRVPRPAGHT